MLKHNMWLHYLFYIIKLTINPLSTLGSKVILLPSEMPLSNSLPSLSILKEMDRGDKQMKHDEGVHEIDRRNKHDK